VRGLYFFAFLLVFWPLADLVTNTIPFQVGNVRWRYGFAGLMAGFLHTPILGLVLATSVAFWRRSRAALRTVAAAELAGAFVLVLVMAMFALDVVQVRATRPPESLSSFIAGASISEAKYLTAFLALLFLGIGSWRTASGMQSTRMTEDTSPGIVTPSGRART